MNLSKIKKMALECLKNKWKNVVLFILCFLLIEYILTSIFMPISKSSAVYNSITSLNFNSLKVNGNIVKGIIRGINYFITITNNLVSDESVNYDVIQLISYLSKGQGIIIIAMFILKTLFEVPLAYALTISFMKLKRGESIGMITFLENDNFQFKRAFSVEIRRIQRLVIPIALIIVFSILLASNYAGLIRSQRLIERLYPYVNYSQSINKYTIKTIIYICLIIITTVYYYTQKLKYIMSFKISYDNPNLSAKQVVEESKKLMMGHRKEYFRLKLSFIGWLILSYFTLCIGHIWLVPYMQVSTICFYDNLKKNI